MKKLLLKFLLFINKLLGFPPPSDQYIGADAPGTVRIRAKVIRANGEVEDLGEVDQSQLPPEQLEEIKKGLHEKS